MKIYVKMKKLFIFLCWICFACFQMSAQTNADWLPSEKQAVFKAMMLDYTLPDGFTGAKYKECFDSMSQHDWIMPCVTSHIISGDKHFHASLLIDNSFNRSNDDHLYE
jgi:hypothetical protein